MNKFFEGLKRFFRQAEERPPVGPKPLPHAKEAEVAKEAKDRHPGAMPEFTNPALGAPVQPGGMALAKASCTTCSGCWSETSTQMTVPSGQKTAVSPSRW